MSQQLILISLLFGCTGVTEKDSGTPQTEQPVDSDTGSEPEADSGHDTGDSGDMATEQDQHGEESKPATCGCRSPSGLGWLWISGMLSLILRRRRSV